MTVIINKPGFNLREALTSLKRKIGIKGAELMAAETADDVYNVIGTNRNRIINGAMVIDQRNAGASITPSVNGTMSLDRWKCGLNTGLAASKYSVQQSSTAPAGFSNSVLITSTSAYTVQADDYSTFSQVIEGFNFADFAFGTANAKSLTISFQIRCSLTGTFAGWIQNDAVNRSFPFTFTINSANTWESKSITIPGDTTGTWVGATNGTGLILGFNLGIGSNRIGTANAWGAGNYRSVTGAVNLIATNGATMYITGVQLEKGTVATPFEHRPYGIELALCQRYFLQSGGAGAYQAIFGAFGTCITTTLATLYFPLPVSMRTSPTLAYTGTPRLDNGQAGFNISAMTAGAVATNLSTGVLNVTSSGLTLYQPVKIDTNAGGSIVTLSAEL